MPDDRPIDHPEQTLRALLERVEVDDIRLYSSTLKQPCIAFRMDGHAAGNYQVTSPEVKFWISSFIWETEGRVADSYELKRTVHVLAGLAMANPIAAIDDPDRLRLVESEPVLAAVLEYVHAQASPRFEHPMQKFWELLRQFAKERDLYRLGTRKFPGGPNVLSRKLKDFAPIFPHLGIEVEIKRSNGSKVILIRLDDPDDESSAGSSMSNPLKTKGMQPEDDRERRLSVLQARATHRDGCTESGGPDR